MKSQRRHELQTNALAAWLDARLSRFRPHGKQIAVAVAAVAVVVLVALFLVNGRSARLEESWVEYFAADMMENPDQLRSVADARDGSLPALWARQRAADLDLARGIRELYTDRSSAREALEQAKKAYQQVIAGARGNPVLLHSAWFGLAAAHESLSELDEAREQYEKIVQAEPGSALAKEAQSRLDRLQDPDVQKFYNWFANQRPVASPPGAGPLDLPDLPGNLNSLSDEPDLGLPGLGGGLSPLTSEPTKGEQPGAAPVVFPSLGPSTPADTPSPPATNDEPPDDAKSDDAKSDDEKSDDEKSGDEKSGDEASPAGPASSSDDPAAPAEANVPDDPESSP